MEKSKFYRQSPEQPESRPCATFLRKETFVIPGMLLSSFSSRRPFRAKSLVCLGVASAYGIGVLGSQVQTILQTSEEELQDT